MVNHLMDCQMQLLICSIHISHQTRAVREMGVLALLGEVFIIMSINMPGERTLGATKTSPKSAKTPISHTTDKNNMKLEN